MILPNTQWLQLISTCVHCVSLQATSDSSSSESPVLQSTGEPVLLQRGALDKDKNSEVVKALVRANPSYASSAAAFSTLLGSSKDDNCESGGTTCMHSLILTRLFYVVLYSYIGKIMFFEVLAGQVA